MKTAEVNTHNVPAAARSKNYKGSLTSAVGVNSTTAPTTATPTGSADTAKVAQNLAADSTDWAKIMRKDIDERTENSLSVGKNLGVDGKATISELVCTALSAASATIQTLTATALTATGATILGALTAATVSATTFNGELNGNAATATRLKTARTIWGQSDDGSGNVSGAMTGVGNISPLATNTYAIGSNHNDFATADVRWMSVRHIDASRSAGENTLLLGYGAICPTGRIDLIYSAGGSPVLIAETDWNGFKVANGNLTVGVMSSIYKLDVNGNARISSDLYTDATVGTRNFASHTTGWNVNANGVADFRNVYADEMRVQAFTADISQALAGSDYLTKSVSKLSANFVVPPVGSSVRIIVDDIEGMPATRCFLNGDYIRFRAFNRTSGLTIANVWGTVTLDTSFGTGGFSNGTQAYTFSCTATTGAGLTVFKGSEVLDYGTSGSGMISRTTLDAQGSPYEQIATWVNDPSNSANYTVHARLGNLGGISNCSGYGVYTDNGYFTGNVVIGDLTKTNNFLSFDAVNGLKMKLGGSNVATTADVSTAQTNAVSQAATNAANLYVASTIYNAYVSATDQALGTKVSQTDFNSLGVTVGQHSTAIQQNAQAITTKVSSTDYTGANIASLINQSASTVTISAAHIDLVGAVTATALTAGCVTSDKVNMTEFTASSGFVDAFNANIVTTGRLDATAILTKALTSNTITATNATIDNLTMTNATVTGTITATAGSVGPFSISTLEGLTATSGDNSLLLKATILRFTKGTTSAVYVGGNVMPGSMGSVLRCPMNVEEKNTGTSGSNAGILFTVTGAPIDDAYTWERGNHALFLSSGHIMGFKTFQRRLNTSQTLSYCDNMIIDTSSSSDSTYTLPAITNIEDGQRIEIISTYRNVKVKPNSNQTIQYGTDTHIYTSSEYISIIPGNYVMCIFDSVNSRWWVRDMRATV